MENPSLGKTRKKMAPQFDVLISSEFYGAHDSWTEYLRYIAFAAEPRQLLRCTRADGAPPPNDFGEIYCRKPT
jgi:hypothetical protein